MFPGLTFLVALLAVSMWFAGLEPVYFIILLVAGILGFLGLIFGDKDKPVSARVTSLLGILLAASPLLSPFVQEYRLSVLANQRARDTVAMYTQFDAIVEALKPQVAEYYRVNGVMPDFDFNNPLPFVDAQGQKREPRDASVITIPTDPFSPSGSRIRIAAVRDLGVLIISVGQDGVADFVLPGPPMDGPPMHHLAPYAMTGQDPRAATYKKSDGPLGLGDLVAYHGRGTLEEVFAPLHQAWDEIHRASPYRPTQGLRPNQKDPDPQSSRDAIAAEKLLIDRKYFAAAALATRGLAHRNRVAAQWTAADMTLNRTRGIALYHLAAYREAADSLATHIEESPDDAVAHFFLGAALARGGNPRAATIHFAAGSQIDPNSPFADQSEAAYQATAAGRQPALPEPQGLAQ